MDRDTCYENKPHGQVKETISGKTLLERVSNNVKANTKEAWNLTNSSQLTDKFEQIAGETLTFAC